MSDDNSTQTLEIEELHQPLLDPTDNVDRQDNSIVRAGSSSLDETVVPPQPVDNDGVTKPTAFYHQISEWKFDFKRNPAKEAEEKRIQCTYYYWTRDLKDTENEAISSSNDMKDSWQDIYTLVGFYSVFQGVLFQAAAQLTTDLGCRFSTIPILLSVFGSATSIAAAWYKLSELREHHGLFVEAKQRAKVLDTILRECRKEAAKSKALVEIDFEGIEIKAKKAADNQKSFFENQLKGTSIRGGFLLVLFFIFSVSVALSIYALICDDQF